MFWKRTEMYSATLTAVKYADACRLHVWLGYIYHEVNVC